MSRCSRLPAGRQALGYDEVSVSGSAVDFWRRGARHGTLARRDLPNSAQRAIRYFDCDAFPRSHFEPFEFPIEDLPRVKGNVFTIPGVYALDPKTRKATRRLRKFVVT